MTNAAPKVSYAREFLASIVVFLIALPLCMGIAQACGVPAHKGLLTGVIGGLICGSLSGCRLGVSGPTAGLTVTIIELIRAEGLSALGPVVLLAGLIQLIAGTLRLGNWFLAVSPAVVRAMMTGMGLLIVASQIHIVLDHQPRGDAISNIMSLPEAVMSLFDAAAPVNHRLAAMVGACTVACAFLWRCLKLDKRLHLPESLLPIVLATAGAWFLGLTIQRVDVPDALSDMITPIGLGQLSVLGNLALLKVALTVALIASTETLLSAASIDQCTGERSDYNKELRAQGIGNLTCGFLGALPVTGVVVRSKANVEAGARTRLSSILHGVWLVLAVGALPFLLEKVPTCALAALLVLTGIRLIDWRAVRDLRKFGWGEVVIFAATVVLIVTTDLLIGVGIGLLLAFARAVWKVLRVNVNVQKEDGNRYQVYLTGAATFVAKPSLARELEKLPMSAEVHLHCDALLVIDHACLELLSNWAIRKEKFGGKVIVDWTDLTKRAHGSNQRARE